MKSNVIRVFFLLLALLGSVSSLAQNENSIKKVPLHFSDSKDSNVFVVVYNDTVRFEVCAAVDIPCMPLHDGTLSLEDLGSIFPGESFEPRVYRPGIREFFRGAGYAHVAGILTSYVSLATIFTVQSGRLFKSLYEAFWVTGLYAVGPASAVLGLAGGAAASGLVLYGMVAAVTVAIAGGAIYWGYQWKNGEKVYKPIEIEMTRAEFSESFSEISNQEEQINPL